MPDEEIDKIVKEAADQHHPPYDDTAWGKMETLLDKHLPQKKDRKRPILFLLLFLLAGSAVFFAVENAQKKPTATVVENTKDVSPAVIESAQAAPSIKTGAADAIPTSIEPTQTLDQSILPAQIPASATTAKNKLQANTKQLYAGNGQVYVDGRKKRLDQKGRLAIHIKKPGSSPGDEPVSKEKELPTNQDLVTTDYVPSEKTNAIMVSDEPAGKKESTKTETIKTAPENITKEEKVSPEKNKKPANKTTKRFADKIGITLSVGAEESFVKIKNAGQFKPAYGAGLNYNLGKHFTVASGFYASKKIYTAVPSDYKFPGGYVYPNLVNIEANCDVYEIPVSVYYNFKAIKKHNWLAGVSLSSFLMKKEVYDYQYKTPSGQTYIYMNTLNNEHKHYFSVLTLSGGYQYKLNNRIAFVAEPYIKVPLSGIGEGKIKLNSTGVLVTAVVKPFAKGKK